MRRNIISALTLISMVIGVSTLALAETAAEDAVKYRQNIMKALSGHGGAVALIASGKAGVAGNMGKHVGSLADLVAEVAAAFEQNATSEDSEALPKVWTDPEGFADAVAELESASATLSAAAGSGDAKAIEAAVKDFRQSCRDCHDDYRKDD
jgi:cytochrome c556